MAKESTGLLQTAIRKLRKNLKTKEAALDKTRKAVAPKKKSKPKSKPSASRAAEDKAIADEIRKKRNARKLKKQKALKL